MPSRRPRLAWLALLGLVVAVLSAGAQTGELTGIVPHQLNPATPAEGRTDVTLREVWRLKTGGTGADAIGMVSAAFLDHEGHVCLLDSDRGALYVYDEAGKRLRTIQPSEDAQVGFHTASGACALDPQGYALVQAYPAMLLRFGPTGTPAGSVVPRVPNLPPPDSARSTISVVGLSPLGEDYVFDCLVEILTPRAGTLTRTHLLGVFGSSGYLERRLTATETESRLDAGVTIEERETVRYQGRWTTGPDGLIYLAPEIYGYRILVQDANGGLHRVISREYTSLPRTPEEHERVQKLFDAFTRNVPRATATVEWTHADIQDLQVARDGSVWVLSSEGRFRAPAGVLGVYDVFDPAGKFVRQVALHGEGDPIEDGVWRLEDRVIVARGLRAAAQARLAGESGASELAIVCYAR